ncbi:MAG: methylenetetrahydrofolate reductase [NAD(P)H] [Propionibacteriaceae bacterium]|jgi:methylenetetrahydrofolate reductase (NADPH)|nr:methylenetetrahydrofolate reductase [NAD(P)H] [Propionibacteriaceae bacterium]
MPTIAQLLAEPDRKTMSFEFFPPKDAAALAQLEQAIKELEGLGPDFISVTYGASGSTRERTIAATAFIQEQTSVQTMGHLTCVSQSVAEIEGALQAYRQAGVRHILALRGDPPGGPTAPWVRHPDGLDNATELVRLVKAAGDFCVGVAAFPDAHPEHHDFELDARILADKQAAGAEFAVTQLFFGAHKYFELVARLRAHGCTLPVIPGIMPITNVSQIERFADLSGAALPADLVSRLQAVQDDRAAVRAIGIETAVTLCRELLAGGAPGLHFFTQNRSAATAEIMTAL